MGVCQQSTLQEDVPDELVDLAAPPGAPGAVPASETPTNGLPRNLYINLEDISDHQLSEVGLPPTADPGVASLPSLSPDLLHQIQLRPRNLTRQEYMDDLRILVNLPKDPMDDIPLELYMLLMGQVNQGEELFYIFRRLFPLFMRWRRDLRHSWYYQSTVQRPDYCPQCPCGSCKPLQVFEL